MTKETFTARCITLIITLAMALTASAQQIVSIDVATHPYKGSLRIHSRDIETMTGIGQSPEQSATTARYYRPSGDSITIVLKDGTIYRWQREDISMMKIIDVTAASVNYSAEMENETVHRFLNEVKYDLNDYSYSVIDQYTDHSVDLDYPMPIEIRLEDMHVYGNELLTLYADPERTIEKGRYIMTEDVFKLWNTVPGDTLYYTITESDGTTLLQAGYATASGQMRIIYAPSVHNVRDLGGWPVGDGKRIKYGLLFRGAKFHDKNAEYLSKADSLRFRALGIKYEMDLRDSHEAAGGLSSKFYSRLGRDVSYGILGSGTYAYRTALADHPETIRYIWNKIKSSIFRADPIFFHCSAGCDRAGTFAFLLEGVLGVAENDLNLDYETSSFYTRYWRKRHEQPLGVPGVFAEMMDYVKTLPGDTLRDKFEYFLVSKAMIPAADIVKLREIMLEDIPQR